jgi:hypothetical protein
MSFGAQWRHASFMTVVTRNIITAPGSTVIGSGLR